MVNNEVKQTQKTVAKRLTDEASVATPENKGVATCCD